MRVSRGLVHVCVRDISSLLRAQRAVGTIERRVPRSRTAPAPAPAPHPWRNRRRPRQHQHPHPLLQRRHRTGARSGSGSRRSSGSACGVRAAASVRRAAPPPPPPERPERREASKMPPFSVRVDPFNWLLDGQLGFELEVGLLDFMSVELVPMFVVNEQPPTFNYFVGSEEPLSRESNGLGPLAGTSIRARFLARGKAPQGLRAARHPHELRLHLPGHRRAGRVRQREPRRSALLRLLRLALELGRVHAGGRHRARRRAQQGAALLPRTTRPSTRRPVTAATVSCSSRPLAARAPFHQPSSISAAASEACSSWGASRSAWHSTDGP